ncbi:MAG: hypothetical protein FJ271_32255 [Planctomycetes bacterium]|nr:hypothetical protein [Planctomycetota bacterium]
MRKDASRGRTSERPTREDIVDLLGDVDDATVTAILSTGASLVEIVEAARWAAGEAIAAVERRPLSGPTSVVYDILVTTPTFDPASSEP